METQNHKLCSETGKHAHTAELKIVNLLRDEGIMVSKASCHYSNLTGEAKCTKLLQMLYVMGIIWENNDCENMERRTFTKSTYPNLEVKQ